MEKTPRQVPSNEVVELQFLSPADIDTDDRAFIHTESGNRYMVRHSKGRGGELVIYNEREGKFSPESGHPFLIRSKTFASVGQPLEYFSVLDETTRRGSEVTTTKVTRIEVRKGLDKIAESEGRRMGRGIADMLKQEVRGKDADSKDPPKEK